MIKVIKCTGDGTGSCKRCSDKGKYSWKRMCFLYKIEEYDGCYCYDCAKEIQEEEGHEK